MTSSAYHPGTGGGDSFQPRRVFGAGGSRGNKATGRTRGNLGGGIFAALRFLRKNESFEIAFAKDKETVIDAEFAADPMDAEGTLIYYDEVYTA